MLTKLFNPQRKLASRLRKTLAEVNRHRQRYAMLTDDSLKLDFGRMREQAAAGEGLDKLLPAAYALIREVVGRKLGLQTYDTQILCAIALHSGAIAEMKTGEGKTLSAVFAACLNSLVGRQVHVVTANDYLALRDAKQMAPVYNFLGVSVAALLSVLNDDQRRMSYSCGVVYGPAIEFANDYLRDRLIYDAGKRLQVPTGMAIVDEADFVLLDSARTPVAITGPQATDASQWRRISETVLGLRPELDYEINLKTKEVHLTDSGLDALELRLVSAGLMAPDSSLYGLDNDQILYKVLAALRAHYAHTRDVDYLVQEAKIVPVNAQTGRATPGRRWTDGLHQALEAKEGLPVTPESVLLASTTLQNYFRMYPKLAGMTGTAMTEAAEFAQVYGAGVVEIPTNRPLRRTDLEDLVFRTRGEKIKAVLDDILEATRLGRPVLVGTITVEDAEHLSACLAAKGLEHHLLTAKNPDHEARLLALAGRPGQITVATNMAGRGVDILLGGNAAVESLDLSEATDSALRALESDVELRRAQVVAAGGMHVIGTERHESRRADNQLRGRVGRQGDPGSSRYYLSLEDALIKAFSPERIEDLMDQVQLAEGEALAHPWVSRTIEQAQKRMEEFNFKLRRELLGFDNVLEAQRRVVYAQRDALLVDPDPSAAMRVFMLETIESLVARYAPGAGFEEQWDLEGLDAAVKEVFGFGADWLSRGAELGDKTSAQLALSLAETLLAQYTDRLACATADPVRIARAALLVALDSAWREHLNALDRIRQSIHLRAYAGKDPVQEFQLEAGRLFAFMVEAFHTETVRLATQAVAATTEAAA